MSGKNTEMFTVKKIKIYLAGRICKFPHCETILNSYNSDKVCNFHRRIIIQLKIETLYKYINYQENGRL